MNQEESGTGSGAGGRRQLLLAVLLTSLLWLVLGGSSLFLWRRPTPAAFEMQPPPATVTPAPSATATPTATAAPLLVDVAGAVRMPGVYSLPPGSRAQQAIDAAGGILSDADLRAISLARALRDGEKLYVPQQGEVPPPASRSASDPEAAAQLEVEEPATPININTADVDALQVLPGIGPKTAQAIVDYRGANGPFETIEDVVQVKGIGEATLESLRPLITVD